MRKMWGLKKCAELIFMPVNLPVINYPVWSIIQINKKGQSEEEKGLIPYTLDIYKAVVFCLLDNTKKINK